MLSVFLIITFRHIVYSFLVHLGFYDEVSPSKIGEERKHLVFPLRLLFLYPLVALMRGFSMMLELITYEAAYEAVSFPVFDSSYISSYLTSTQAKLCFVLLFITLYLLRRNYRLKVSEKKKINALKQRLIS